MLRNPIHRLRSGFPFRHAVGIRVDLAKGTAAEQLARLSTVAEYAAFPGIAGCQTKMILGKACASNQTGASLAAKGLTTKTAKARLRTAYAFVGITSWWNLSVCLFHAEFGGEVWPASFQNSRKTVLPKSGRRDHAGDGPVLNEDTDGFERGATTADGLSRHTDSMDFQLHVFVCLLELFVCLFVCASAPIFVKCPRILPCCSQLVLLQLAQVR
jgi:hypothetical protein